jgi:uncharacterized protein YwlG (UPF0340 family)
MRVEYEGGSYADLELTGSFDLSVSACRHVARALLAPEDEREQFAHELLAVADESERGQSLPSVTA